MARNTIADAVANSFDYLISNVNTAIPATITHYDDLLKKATVKPLIMRTFSNGTVVSMPIIANVPVVMPRNALAGLNIPVSVGDTVLLIFSQRSLERWLFDGGEVEPGLDRKFDLTDAIAIIGLYSFNSSLPTEEGSLFLYCDKAKIKIDKNSKIAIGNDSDELLAILSDTLDDIKNIKVDGKPIENQSAFTSLKNRLNTIKGSL